jgi:hypothetical protein
VEPDKVMTGAAGPNSTARMGYREDHSRVSDLAAVPELSQPPRFGPLSKLKADPGNGE